MNATTIDETRPIEFLFNADLEAELHGNEDPALGVHSREVLQRMLAEARCEGEYAGFRPPDFVLSNGDTDTRFEEDYRGAWRELEAACPCYHVVGNHEGGYFEGDAVKWRECFGYPRTYYAWEYRLPEGQITFVVLDLWSSAEADGVLRIGNGSGKQVFREEQRRWLRQLISDAEGMVVAFAHAHMWPPEQQAQDNDEVVALLSILTGGDEEGHPHRGAQVFFNGGHHDYPDLMVHDGVWLVDPLAGIHGGYARVIIDPVAGSMEYRGRLNERSYPAVSLQAP